MEIKSKLYPYPVLSEYSNDYRRCKFHVVVRESVVNTPEGKQHQIDFKTILTSNGLLSLIQEKKACYAFHLECSQTSFRKVIQSFSGNETYLLKDEDLNGRLEISCFIVATEDIKGYSSPEFHHSYKNIKGFDIDEGCILATDRTTVIEIDKYQDEIAHAPSIFSIIKNMDKTDSHMLFDMQGSKILIKLPEKDYCSYGQLSRNPSLTPMLNSLTIVPALIYVLEELARNPQDNKSEYGDSLWYRALRKILLEQFQTDIDTSDFDSRKDIVALAQELVEYPVSKAFNFLTEGSLGGEDE